MDRPATTNLRTNPEDNKYNIRLHQRRLQRNRPPNAQADHKAADVTGYRPNCYREKDPTVNKTARKPANTKPARHARVETRTAPHGLATTQCATPAGDHTHEHTTTPRFYHSITDQPTTTTYFEPPTPRTRQLTITGCAQADPRTRCLHDRLGRDSAGSSRKNPTMNKLTIRRLTHACTKRKSCGNNDATINRPHTSRPT